MTLEAHVVDGVGWCAVFVLVMRFSCWYVGAVLCGVVLTGGEYYFSHITRLFSRYCLFPSGGEVQGVCWV